MNPEVERLLDLVADTPTERRATFLEQHCPDPRVRAEVLELLDYVTEAEARFDAAIRGVAASVRRAGEPEPGELIGNYRLLSVIGRGGMGTIWLAERADGELRQQVAIKLLRFDMFRSFWRERFLTERQLLASLNHPSIVHAIDAGRTDDGRAYLVMEYVDGVSIDRYAARIPVREQLKLFLRVCEGVSYAHRRLIIHRDLKPSNILVDSTGQPKLLDFGIAKLLDGAADWTQTAEQV